MRILRKEHVFHPLGPKAVGGDAIQRVEQTRDEATIDGVDMTRMTRLERFDEFKDCLFLQHPHPRGLL